MKKVFTLVFFLLLALASDLSLCLAIEIRPAGRKDITDAFHSVDSFQGHFYYVMAGSSVLTHEQDVHSGWVIWKLPDRKNLKKAYLLWAGEIKEGAQKEKAGQVIFEAPSGKKSPVTSKLFYKIQTGNDLSYTAVSDVTDYLEETGRYGISGIQTRKDRFGGYALIGIYEDLQRPISYIQINAGMARLKPGEIYDISLLPQGVKGRVTQVSTVGGDGKAGNGSSNHLGGLAVSGGDDWDGSSGFRWDVDHYDIEKFKIFSDRGLTWSIDPLLQWLSPVCIVVQIDINQ